ncbi:MAG: DUF3830 family protein [Dehalococcoidia bacterium]|jgi:hypothetical protein|nr:DUF3830 family protein [Dehalococcoidia bacterium]
MTVIQENLVFQFPKEGISARARLLPEVAPKTVLEIVAGLPFEGMSHHGIYSGSECVLLLDQFIQIEQENARSVIKKGEIAYTYMKAGQAYGVEEDFSEICWFYDIDAEPRMWEGPVLVNVFAEFIEPVDEFFSLCRRMRREGVKELRVEEEK